MSEPPFEIPSRRGNGIGGIRPCGGPGGSIDTSRISGAAHNFKVIFIGFMTLDTFMAFDVFIAFIMFITFITF